MGLSENDNHCPLLVLLGSLLISQATGYWAFLNGNNRFDIASNYALENAAGPCASGFTIDGIPIEGDTVESDVLACPAVAEVVLTDEQTEWLQGLREDDLSQQTFRVRQEIRLLSDVDWQAIVRGIIKLKSTMVGTLSQFDILAEIHSHDVAPSGTRAGPGTYAWHREYLIRMEAALRAHEPSVSLPYWDISLDTYLPYLYDSVIFSEKFFGSCGDDSFDRSSADLDLIVRDTAVTAVPLSDGVFANFSNIPSCAASMKQHEPPTRHTKVLTRSCLSYPLDGTSRSYNDAEISTLLNWSSFSEMVSGTCFLRNHDNAHWMMGGTTEYKKIKTCAVADPATWFMHMFQDYLWERFRTEAQVTSPSLEYPDDNEVIPCHVANYTMIPLTSTVTTMDGMSNDYTSLVYSYEQSPHACTTESDCGSTFLWCSTIGRCMSKLKDGGACVNLGDSACYSGKCDSETNTCAASS